MKMEFVKRTSLTLGLIASSANCFAALQPASHEPSALESLGRAIDVVEDISQAKPGSVDLDLRMIFEGSKGSRAKEAVVVSSDRHQNQIKILATDPCFDGKGPCPEFPKPPKPDPKPDPKPNPKPTPDPKPPVPVKTGK